MKKITFLILSLIFSYCLFAQDTSHPFSTLFKDTGVYYNHADTVSYSVDSLGRGMFVLFRNSDTTTKKKVVKIKLLVTKRGQPFSKAYSVYGYEVFELNMPYYELGSYAMYADFHANGYLDVNKKPLKNVDIWQTMREDW